MANKLLAKSIIISIFPVTLAAQVPPINKDYTFSGRYVVWAGNSPMPASISIVDNWLLQSSGFFSQTFQIPLYYDDTFKNMAHATGDPSWIDALNTAVSEWNAKSDILQLSTPQALGSVQNTPVIEYPPKPTIFVDDQAQYFRSGDIRAGDAIREIIKASKDCSSNQNWSGPVIAQADIAINGNGNHKFFTGEFGFSDETSLVNVLEHELGHLRD